MPICSSKKKTDNPSRIVERATSIGNIIQLVVLHMVVERHSSKEDRDVNQ